MMTMSLHTLKAMAMMGEISNADLLVKISAASESLKRAQRAIDGVPEPTALGSIFDDLINWNYRNDFR